MQNGQTEPEGVRIVLREVKFVRSKKAEIIGRSKEKRFFYLPDEDLTDFAANIFHLFYNCLFALGAIFYSPFQLFLRNTSIIIIINAKRKLRKRS